MLIKNQTLTNRRDVTQLDVVCGREEIDLEGTQPEEKTMNMVIQEDQDGDLGLLQ